MWFVTCWMHGNFIVVCLSFIVEMRSNKDTRYKQTNCRPAYIRDRIDIWSRFWNLCCSVIRTWPTHFIKVKRVQIIHLKGSLRLTKWHKPFHLKSMKHLCITVWLEWNTQLSCFADFFFAFLLEKTTQWQMPQGAPSPFCFLYWMYSNVIMSMFT